MKIVSRIIAVSAFLMSVAFSANAQYGPSSKGQGSHYGIRQGTNGGAEYKGIVEGGVGYDFFEEQLALSVSTSHGVIFNDSFFIGANVGFFHSRVAIIIVMTCTMFRLLLLTAGIISIFRL